MFGHAHFSPKRARAFVGELDGIGHKVVDELGAAICILSALTRNLRPRVSVVVLKNSNGNRNSNSNIGSNSRNSNNTS